MTAVGIRYSRDREVILNANTLETTAAQYNSMVLEKHCVDRCQANPRFGQFFPSSEFTRNRMNPGTGPTFMHRELTHGHAGLVNSGGTGVA